MRPVDSHLQVDNETILPNTRSKQLIEMVPSGLL